MMMNKRDSSKKGELFIVDNSDITWKVQKYLSEWCELSKKFDIATGYFEIGSLLDLNGKWQNLEKIRILMGDEVSRRTKQAFEDGLSYITAKLDDSIEQEKEENDFLEGVPAIVESIRNKSIECKIYRKKKFHAKAYITHSKFGVVGSAALVGSSNFTLPGITENVELNVQIKDEIETLQEWFERHWKEAEDVTPEILKTVERHTREYSPFEVYTKALYEYFKGHKLTASEWELKKSKVYPILDQYQKDGYHALMKIASRHNGAFLCDSVGLGKTFIGLMLIERLLLRENKRVVLVVPKAARKPVWESKIKKYVPDILNGFLPFRIINHTDLTRQAGGDVDWPEFINKIGEQAEVIVIDESHHFRNRTADRYRKLFDIAEDKTIFLLTATPVNNTLFDLMHQIELFSRRDERYFSEAPLGIHSLRAHFIRLEKDIKKKVSGDEEVAESTVDSKEARDTVAADDKKAFNKANPLLTLAVYYPLAYYKGPDTSIDPMQKGRQKQVVGLIRTLLLKRFESSRRAFEYSCEDLLMRLIVFCRKHDERRCSVWERQHEDILNHVRKRLKERGKIDEEEVEEDYFPEEFLQKIAVLSDEDYKVGEIVSETMRDMNQLVVFIDDLIEVKDNKDDKIEKLIATIEKNPILRENKVLIFSEYMDTAKYVAEVLEARGFNDVAGVDSSTPGDRGDIINRFSPYYNDLSSAELRENGEKVNLFYHTTNKSICILNINKLLVYKDAGHI